MAISGGSDRRLASQRQIPATIEGCRLVTRTGRSSSIRGPTAFRAREREELLPTLHQLRRKNTDVVMKWFARGQVWTSPEEAQTAQRAPKLPRETCDRDWRPGGAHRGPRDRLKSHPKTDGKRVRPHGSGPSKPFSSARSKPSAPRDRAGPRKLWLRDGSEPHRTPETQPKRQTGASAGPPPTEPMAIKPKPPEHG